MSNTAYIGSGTTLSSKYYLRSFYRSNREAGTSSKRREFSGNQLALADGRALRQAVRRLTSSDFSDDQDANTRNSVLAYIQTYNNMLSSAGSSSDRTLERSAKQLKNITSEYSSELDKIGITVNDDGTLTSRTTLFESADLSKFKELFSADAAYMQRTSTYAKRFASRGASCRMEGCAVCCRLSGNAHRCASHPQRQCGRHRQKRGYGCAFWAGSFL